MSRSLSILLLTPLTLLLLLPGTARAGKVIAWITEVVASPILDGLEAGALLNWVLMLLGL